MQPFFCCVKLAVQYRASKVDFSQPYLIQFQPYELLLTVLVFQAVFACSAVIFAAFCTFEELIRFDRLLPL